MAAGLAAPKAQPRDRMIPAFITFGGGLALGRERSTFTAALTVQDIFYNRRYTEQVEIGQVDQRGKKWSD
jgi:hypothetical protein